MNDDPSRRRAEAERFARNTSAEPGAPAYDRHSWVKLRLHVYMCRQCGTGYENTHQTTGEWRRRYFLPTGEIKFLDHVPKCAPGPKTAAALRKYANAL